MVPASTSRRKVDTMNGSRTSTPTTTPPMSTMSFMTSLPFGWAFARIGNRAAIARRIHVLDPEPVAPAHPPHRRAILRAEGAEQLHHLAVELQPDQPLAPGVEVGLRAGLFHDRALQRRRWPGREPEHEVPDRPHQEALEHVAAEEGAGGDQRLDEHRAQHEPGDPRPGEEAEEDPGREEPEQLEAGALGGLLAVPVPVRTGVARRRTGVAVPAGGVPAMAPGSGPAVGVPRRVVAEPQE